MFGLPRRIILLLQTWCPKCAALRSVERRKLTLADMHQTARQFGGVFLSSEYKGAAVKVCARKEGFVILSPCSACTFAATPAWGCPGQGYTLIALYEEPQQ